MSLLRRLGFRQREHTTELRFNGNFVEISQISFFGRFASSPDRRYSIAWHDSGADAAGRATKGRYVLLEQGRILLVGELERPNDGKVANNGVFILNDWMSAEDLSGTFYVFHPNGSPLIQHRFEANLHNNGLSADGRYAVCQLCHCESPDGGTLAFFDVFTSRLLWQVWPEPGWANSYRIEVENQRVVLGYEGLGEFAYSFAGTFLDRLPYRQTAVKLGRPYDVCRLAETLLEEAHEDPNPESAMQIIELLRLAASRTDLEPGLLAAVVRCLGEAHEQFGHLQVAMECYQRAIELNPKIGVKKKLARMRREHG